jgi:hypothetical protein
VQLVQLPFQDIVLTTKKRLLLQMHISSHWISGRSPHIACLRHVIPSSRQQATQKPRLAEQTRATALEASNVKPSVTKCYVLTRLTASPTVVLPPSFPTQPHGLTLILLGVFRQLCGCPPSASPAFGNTGRTACQPLFRRA